ncbi:unnamed protein product [Soboliphyme baturini]|uniref:EGF-like domain-containing protein n=1 Tax=Soboliphyme baturini TaxID=241478 RepID=A0A183IMK2_9BILA|nr:unnamed protein product [Soboliphyme baturini]
MLRVMDQTVPPALKAILIFCEVMVLARRYVFAAAATVVSSATTGEYFSVCDSVARQCRHPLVCSRLRLLSSPFVCLCPEGFTWDLNLSICTAQHNFSLSPCSPRNNSCSDNEFCWLMINSTTDGFCICKPGFQRNRFLYCVPIAKSSLRLRNNEIAPIVDTPSGRSQPLTLSISGPRLVTVPTTGVRFVANLTSTVQPTGILYRWSVRRILNDSDPGFHPSSESVSSNPMILGEEDKILHLLDVQAGQYLVQLNTFTPDGDARAELLFTARRSNCDQLCSGHSACDQFTGLCRCDKYWMPNLVAFYFDGKLNCVHDRCELDGWKEALNFPDVPEVSEPNKLSKLLCQSSDSLDEKFVLSALNNIESFESLYSLSLSEQRKLVGVVAGCSRETAIEALRRLIPSTLLTPSSGPDLTELILRISSVDLMLRFLTVFPGVSERSMVAFLQFALRHIDADMPSEDSQKLMQVTLFPLVMFRLLFFSLEVLRMPHDFPYLVRELKILSSNDVKVLLRYVRVLLIDCVTCANKEASLSQVVDFLNAVLDAQFINLIRDKDAQDDLAQCQMAVYALVRNVILLHEKL